MADIEKMADYYGHLGYSERNADARVCQDIKFLEYIRLVEIEQTLENVDKENKWRKRR